MAYKNVSFRLDEKVAEELKEMAFKSKTSQQALFNKYIINGLKEDKNQTELEVE